ncbi:MarR family transcriptional regulator, partial [Ruminococcus sp.]|uniref:MarR family transcriptional regulator n=3 Tax=Ruminococcus sp. TaxID=41978 RepID=UPI003AF53506
MVDNVRRECIMSMYEIYPLSRKLVFDTFDKKKYDITRTQQIIMLSLCIEGTLTMSQLASKINTSNEQATRAVAQLVDKGFVIRMQNPDNRRVINIRLTDEAMRFMEKMKNGILDDILGKFSSVSAGADAVIAEGTESGGHIGENTTMCLVPQVVDAVEIPVIA